MDNPKILIVDDEKTLATFLAKVLKEDNPELKIEIKLTGEEALEALPEIKPDVALLDIKLPKKDGTQVLKEIKEYDADIQVVMMTGYASLDSAIASLREGAYDYINKPFETSQVIIIVKNALERRMLIKERNILIGDLSEANEKLAEANTLLKEKKELVDKALENRIEQLSKLNKISHKINAEVNITNLIKQIPASLVDLSNASGSVMFFLDENKSNLIVKGCAGDTPFTVGTKIGAKTSPFDVAITKKSVAQVNKIKIGKTKVGPLICSSLSSGGKNIGALCVLCSEEMDKDSLQLLNTFALTSSIALENASLFDNLKRSTLEIIISLLLIEGFKDPAIKEHSERISELAGDLSEKMGVNKEDIRHIKYAALIHDIGKVVMKEETSNYSLVLKKTFNILGHVKFLKMALKILKYSTEDFSKKGNKIPLLSRIFSVVNSFDELVIAGNKVLNVIKDLEKDKKYDPKVVENFKKILKSKTQ